MTKSNKQRKPKFNPYMMATKAFHQLGEISSDGPDLCHINSVDGDYYVGSWVTGYGFFNVRFPKETTRNLTTEEVEKYNNQTYQLSDHRPFKLLID